MTDEVKSMIQRIYFRQLNGIMHHFDLAQLYKLFKMRKCFIWHYRKAMEETEAHAATCFHIIEKYDEIVRADNIARVPLVTITERPMSKLECESTCKQIMKAWLQWEKDTLQAYAAAMGLMPDCRLWKILHRDTAREIAKVETKLGE